MQPEGDAEEAPNNVVSGFATSALEAAKVEVMLSRPLKAEGLTEAAISAAVHVAQVRSKSYGTKELEPVSFEARAMEPVSKQEPDPVRVKGPVSFQSVSSAMDKSTSMVTQFPLP